MQGLDANFFIKFLYSISFCLLLLFSLFEFRVRVRVMSGSHCHTSVTSDDTVIVIVTSHKVMEKNIEGSRKMILYNMCKIYVNLKENTWSFRVG